MKKIDPLPLVIIGIWLIAFGVYFLLGQNTQVKIEPPSQEVGAIEKSLTNFTGIDATYRFSAILPEQWLVTYVPELDAVSIVDADLQSQIFIRNFTANDFLTLSTVTISEQTDKTVKGHQAIEYEITKKPEAPDFPSAAPPWRNITHRSIDVRFTEQNPSPFYTIAYNPSLNRDIYDAFIDSLVFHNDRDSLQPVMTRAQERITKKPFGIYITPQDSPIPDEKFTGYHTAVDLEVFEEELGQDVPVNALCGGQLRVREFVNGYGGVAVQDCLLDDQAVTVLYGHLDIDSIEASIGDYLNPGDEIGLLGAHLSPETDGERKHLHMGIRKGSMVNFWGYVGTEQELSGWTDPQEYLTGL